MLIWICRLLFRLKGFRFNPNLPEGARRSILLAAPHTSNWDAVITLAAFSFLKTNARFTIKKEHNRFLIGKMLENAGALWIDRSPKVAGEARKSMVSVMTEIIREHEAADKELMLLITPEGTRSKRTEWKTGFYYLALETGWPISLGYVDYEKKIAGVGETFHLSGNKEADMLRIMRFYENIPARFPEKFSVDKRYA